MCTEKMHIKVRCIKYGETNNKINTVYPTYPIQKSSVKQWQALIKPWDGFCGPLEVRMHPLPPPDSGASLSSFGSSLSRFGCFVFEIQGSSFSSFGCFVFEFWVLLASVFVFERFVFETTLKSLLKMLFRRKDAAEKFFFGK